MIYKFFEIQITKFNHRFNLDPVKQKKKKDPVNFELGVDSFHSFFLSSSLVARAHTF